VVKVDREAQEIVELDLMRFPYYLGSLKGLAKYLTELGYHKLPEGKPRLLTDEGIVEAQEAYIEKTWQQTKVSLSFPLTGYRRDECLIQAQYDICVKHYGGKE
jgi:hypothetical protein